MRQFDAICPPPVRAFGASDIKRLRESLKFSQPVFALHLHTSVSTVRKWEQGETHPVGPALKLLNVIADKGLQAITCVCQNVNLQFSAELPDVLMTESDHAVRPGCPRSYADAQA